MGPSSSCRGGGGSDNSAEVIYIRVREGPTLGATRGIRQSPPLLCSQFSPELAAALGDLRHVEHARPFHLLARGRKGINKPPRAPHSHHGFPQGISQE